MRHVAVWTELSAYRGAVGELSASTRRAEGQAGAICVVPGAGRWWDAATRAVDAGACAVVIADPDVGPAPAVSRLDAVTHAGVPVIVERPRLRADVIADAQLAAPPLMILADVVASAKSARASSRDAIGWLRALTGGPPTVLSVARGRHSLIAALETTAGVPAALSITTSRVDTCPAIDVIAIGDSRLELRIDDATGTRSIRQVRAEGALEPAARLESSARLALRRALAAVAGEPVADLDELCSDSSVDALLWPDHA